MQKILHLLVKLKSIIIKNRLLASIMKSNTFTSFKNKNLEKNLTILLEKSNNSEMNYFKACKNKKFHL